MLRRLLAVLAVLAAVPVGAGVVRSSTNVSGSGGGTFTGGTITSPILLPDGSVSAPALARSTQTNTGLYWLSNALVYGALGEGRFAFDSDTLLSCPTCPLAWKSGAGLSGTTDLYLYRDAANTLAQRNGTNAQTFNWYYSYTDASNYHRGALKTSASGIEIAAETAGSGADNLDITLTPAGTGQVKTSKAVVSGGFFAGTVSTASKALMNTAGSVQVASGGFFGFTASSTNADTTGDTGIKRISAGVLGVTDDASVPIILQLGKAIQGSTTKALTESSATTFVTVAVPQTAGANYAAGRVGYTVYAADATDAQTLHGVAQFSAVNKSGTETCAAIADVQTAVAESAGGSTLTCTITCVTGLTDVIGLAADCVSSLTQTTLQIQARLDLEQPNTLVFP